MYDTLLADAPLKFPDLMALGIGRRPLMPGIIHPFKVTDPAIVKAIEDQVAHTGQQRPTHCVPLTVSLCLTHCV